MPGILERLYRIARAYAPNARDALEKWLTEKEADIRSRKGGDYSRSGSERPKPEFEERQAADEPPANPFPGVPPQVVADLSIFGLAPPSSLAAVKKARNQEIKKYHSDRFMNDPDRLDTSKQIMQIYNAAYDRLEAYYERRSE